MSETSGIRAIKTLGVTLLGAALIGGGAFLWTVHAQVAVHSQQIETLGCADVETRVQMREGIVAMKELLAEIRSDVKELRKRNL